MKTRFVVGEKETESFGMSLAPLLHAGDVLWLRGELGAGKTVFARGVARGLGVRGPLPARPSRCSTSTTRPIFP